MGGADAVRRTGRSLGMRQALHKRPPQPPPANPAWYTVSPTVPSTPITGANPFEVSPGIDVGKAGSVRQAISAGNVVDDAAKVLADIAGAGATMSPEEKEAGVHRVATALEMASVLIEKSAGLGTKRAKGMTGIGGAYSHRCAIASQDANRRRKEARAHPYGGVSNSKRTPMGDITAVVNDPGIVGLQLVNPKAKKPYAQVGARSAPPPFFARPPSLLPRAPPATAIAAVAAALGPPRPRTPQPQFVRCPLFGNLFLNSNSFRTSLLQLGHTTKSHRLRPQRTAPDVPAYPRPTHCSGDKRLCYTNPEIADILRPLGNTHGKMKRVHDDWIKRGYAVPT